MNKSETSFSLWLYSHSPITTKEGNGRVCKYCLDNTNNVKYNNEVSKPKLRDSIWHTAN